jgi:hypothetical protein
MVLVNKPTSKDNAGQGVFEARDLLIWYNSNFDKGNK